MVKFIIEILLGLFLLIVFVSQVILPLFTPGMPLFPYWNKEEDNKPEDIGKSFTDLEQLDQETEEAMKRRNEVVSGIEAAQEKLKSIKSKTE